MKSSQNKNTNEKLLGFLPCVGQKSWQFFVHILGETMTSYIHSEINWPLALSLACLSSMQKIQILTPTRNQIFFLCCQGSFIVRHSLSFHEFFTPFRNTTVNIMETENCYRGFSPYANFISANFITAIF